MTDIAERPAAGTPPDPAPMAPRTTEQLIASAASAHDLGYGRRPARGHGYEMRGLAYLPVSQQFEGRFGRMFRLSPFVPSDARIAEIAALMTENATGPTPELDNPTIPAGYTYLGQFIDHDLTFDTASSLDRANDPDALTNFRSPRFDLDCVYGRGPTDDPFLYDRDSGGEQAARRPARRRGRPAPQRRRRPRCSATRATTRTRSSASSSSPCSSSTTRSSTWSRPTRRCAGAARPGSRPPSGSSAGTTSGWSCTTSCAARSGRRCSARCWTRAGTARSCAGSSTRGGGSRTCRWSSRWRPTASGTPRCAAGTSSTRWWGRCRRSCRPAPTTRPPGCGIFGGFRILPPLWTIEWARFFEVDGAGSDARQQTRLIDTKLADPLAALPPEIAGNRPSLIDRNLTRGARLLLPSGQDVAQHMGADVLTDAELGLPGGGPAPLWYYVLREAEVQAGGHHLGQVGGRIVAEVFLGLMEKDPSSYLRNEPRWTPFLASGGDFTMPDLLAFTGHGLGQTGGAPPAPQPAPPA